MKTLKVLILGLSENSVYDNYGDFMGSNYRIDEILKDSFVDMTQTEYEILLRNRHEVARQVGLDDFFIALKPEPEQMKLTGEAINNIAKKTEKSRLAKLAEAEKRRKAYEEKEKERQIAKAKKALEKARKTLQTLGDAEITE